MAGTHILTVGAVSQLDDALNGQFLKGRREPRIAVVGRSNVGKSSLVNALVGTSVAQVSKQPGKTRLLHFYHWLEGKRIIADLPGYGYARAAKADRDRWAGFVNAYLAADEGLALALVLLDGRVGPTELDEEAIRFLAFERMPVVFAFTKSDQLKTQSERARRKKEAAQAIQALGLDPEESFWVSSRDGDGVKRLAARLIRP